MNRLVMFFFVFLALLSFTVRSQCQTYIFGRADFPVGNNPTGVAAGDFNGDGLTDLVAANNGDDTISILLARPDGTFAPQVIYSTGPKPVSTVSTDLNGDGNLDLVVTNENCTAGPSGLSCSSPGTVSILLGNGDGTFQPHVDYVVGKLPSSVAIADVNGDGNPDLAVANTFDGTVSVLLGNGDGTFQPQMLYATAGQSSWRSVVVADFNGDGKLDLAVNCDSSVSVLLGNGDGTFQAHMDSSIGVTGGISLATGDFNHDGKPDLAVTTQVGGALVSVLLGVGDGTFLVQAQYAGGSFVAVNDLNGDGKLDLIETGAVNASSFFVAVRLGNGDGTFQSEVHYGTGNSPFGFMVVDLNGDGKLDLAIANAGCNIVGNACSGQQVPPGTISILLGLGDGTFVGKADYGTPGALAIATADFNKDSNLDLATANQLSDSVSLLLGNGNGTFQPETSYPVGHLPVWVASGDFRNNGDVDLVTANEICPGSSPCNPGTVSVLLGNGDGTFQPHTDYNVGLFPISVVVGSLRGNGTLDLAVVNRGSSSVSILLGNGDGTFQPQVSYLTAFSPEQVVIGDFNQDSKPDLAIALGGGVSILLGNGDGTFKSHIDYPGGSLSIVTGDFNADGKLDLATGGSGTVALLLGNGDGTFQAPVIYQTGTLGAVFSIDVTDFNGDGKLDLSINNGSEALFLLGNGDGSFQPPTGYLIADFISSSLAVSDFNGDGVPDWAAPDADDNKLGVMLSTAFKATLPGLLNFGSQGIGTTSNQQTITISNPSNAKINIAGITSSGNFGQTNNCGTSLNPGETCQVNATFSPTGGGLQSGFITLTDNTLISPLSIPLRGTAVSGAFLTPNPRRENFSPQIVGATSNPAAIALENTGNTPLNLAGINITGINGSDFSQTNNCGGALAPASSCIVNVKFTPMAGGFRIARLSVSDTAPGSPHTIGLSGTGLAPISSLNPNVLTFPSQTIGTTSGAQVVTLTDTGNTVLNITNIATSGDFTETNTCNTSLLPGNNCQISVKFTPTATGNQVGTLTITDNAGGSPHTISLSGIGAAAPDFTIAPVSGSSSSQTINAGQSAAFNLVVAPAGTFTGTVNLSCAVTPVVSPAPSCGLSVSSVQLTSISQTVTVTVTTTAPMTAKTMPPTDFPSRLIVPVWTAMLLGLGWLWLRNPRWRLAGGTVVVLMLALCLGCGGSSSTDTIPRTPAGTYTATLTATSGNVSHTTTFTVIVR